MSFGLIRGDITQVQANAIVNAANVKLMPGGGVCGAIFKAAGFEPLLEACMAIGHCPVGEAVATPGFALSKVIIHTAGPVWKGGQYHEHILLENAYRNSVKLAVEKGCESIAFPLISAGIFGYPKNLAFDVASQVLRECAEQYDIHIILVLFESIKLLNTRQEADLMRYIEWREQQTEADDTLELNAHNASEEDFDDFAEGMPDFMSAPFLEKANLKHASESCHISLEEALEEVEPSFSEYLVNLILERCDNPAQIYKKANIDRKLFSKIRNNREYKPGKAVVLAFAVALELDWEETSDLLASAGYAFSHSSRFDIIVEYYIKRENYDIFEINEALFQYEQPLLGSQGG